MSLICAGRGYNDPYSVRLPDHHHPSLPGMGGLFASLGSLPLISSRSLPPPSHQVREAHPEVKGRAHSFSVEAILKNDSKSQDKLSTISSASTIGGDSSGVVFNNTEINNIKEQRDSSSLPVIVSSLYGTLSPAILQQHRHNSAFVVPRSSNTFSVNDDSRQAIQNARENSDENKNGTEKTKIAVKDEDHGRDCNGNECLCIDPSTSFSTASSRGPRLDDVHSNSDVTNQIKVSFSDCHTTPSTEYCLQVSNALSARSENYSKSFSSASHGFHLLSAFAKKELNGECTNINDTGSPLHKNLSAPFSDDLISPYVHKLNHSKGISHPYFSSQYYTGHRSAMIPVSKSRNVGSPAFTFPTPYCSGNIFPNCSSYSSQSLASIATLTHSTSQFPSFPTLNFPPRPSPLSLPFSLAPSLTREVSLPCLRASPSSTPPASPPLQVTFSSTSPYTKRISDTKLKIVNPHNSSIH